MFMTILVFIFGVLFVGSLAGVFGFIMETKKLKLINKSFVQKNTPMYPPGTDNLASGKYIEVNMDGYVIQPSKFITIDQGDRLPPTREAGRFWMNYDELLKDEEI